MFSKIYLKQGKEKSLQRFHPWVFSGALASDISTLAEGDVVEIYAADKQYLATGYIQHDSISVKILSFEQTDINFRFWEEKFLSAINYRKQLGFFDNKNTNVFRLINGEGDFLPGLIIDWYDGVVVIQCHSQGMYKQKDIFCEILHRCLPGKIKSIYNKSAATLPRNSLGNFIDGFLFGKEEEICSVTENGNQYLINLRESQKTGFFIDQRENRKLLQEIALNKTVLNTFGYTGGFSVSALKGGARLACTLDISKKAIEACNENVHLNFGDNAPHKAEAVDVLKYLNQMEDSYDIIVLDPPAFSKHQKDLQQGLKAYRNINQKALEKINSGGFLFTFSCSQAVSVKEFATLVFSTSAVAKRKVRIIRTLPHAQDHPVNIFHPEGEYLKGLLLYVE